MPLRGGLGLSSGSYTQVPIPLLNGFAVKRPCRSSHRASFLAPKPHEATRSQPARVDPLFLLFCGLRWHKSGETSAGWELVQAMRSGDRGARALAAELLAETENGRLLVRDLRRTISGLDSVTTPGFQSAIETIPTEGKDMNTPYGLPIIENCTTCPIREKGWYCDLSSELLRAFDGSSRLATYPGGAILFVEGQMPRGA